jgi:hypothetical protein
VTLGAVEQGGEGDVVGYVTGGHLGVDGGDDLRDARWPDSRNSTPPKPGQITSTPPTRGKISC